MDRPSSGSGWLLRVLDVKTGKEIEEEWEKVILCLGVSSFSFSLDPIRGDLFLSLSLSL